MKIPKQNPYHVKSFLLIILKFFITGLGLTLPFLFQQPLLDLIFSFVISLLIVKSIFDLWKKMKNVCPKAYLIGIPLSSVASGFLFGFVLYSLFFDGLNEYQDLKTVSVVLAISFLLLSLGMVYFLKPIWNLPKNKIYYK